jgi:hypothetical protein
MYTIAQVFKCKRGKLQLQQAKRLLEDGEQNAPEQI